MGDVDTWGLPSTVGTRLRIHGTIGRDRPTGLTGHRGSVDDEVFDRGLAVDEVSVILRIEDRSIDVISSKGND